MTTVPLDLDDIQGNVAPGFRSDFQDLLFVRFPNAAAGRQWLAALDPEVTSCHEVAAFVQLRKILRRNAKNPTRAGAIARPERPSSEIARVVRTTWINVALTAAGLETIMDPAKFAAAKFPAAFLEGMAARSSQIGDRQDEVAAWSVRDHAEAGSPNAGKVAHALLTLGADTADDLDAETARQVQRLAALGIQLVERHRGNTLGGGREHFGFRDGISQPEPDADTLLAGWTTSKTDDVIKPGEIIVGLPDEDCSTSIVGPTWARNGSYLVFRRLRQDVPEFRRTVQSQTTVLAAKIPQVSADLVAAKLVGRWPGGAKLDKLQDDRAAQTTDPFPMNPNGGYPPGGEPLPSAVKLDSSEYASDKKGDGCPVVAHVRRAHPRASPEHEPNRHRIIRRGIPYGPMLPPGATDDVDRGLLFVAYQADISRGFETIQGSWFNSPNTPEKSLEIGVSNGWDPLTGVANYPGTQATQPRRIYIHVPGSKPTKTTPIDVGRLVEVTAGGYFFAPPISALARLAAGG